MKKCNIVIAILIIFLSISLYSDVEKLFKVDEKQEIKKENNRYNPEPNILEV